MQTPNKPSDRLLVLALLLTGFSGLGYEIIWTRLLVLSVGAEHAAVLGVLGGYFLGLSLGALLFHRRVLTAAVPLRYYCVLELIAAAYAVLSPILFARFAGWMPRVLAGVIADAHPLVALLISIAVSGALLLPATVCLGATLPAVVESRRRLQGGDHDDRRGMGRLYGANTLGAMLGVLGTVYVLLPRLGMIGATIVNVTLALSAVALVWVRYRQRDAFPPVVNDSAAAPPAMLPRRGLVLLFCTGFAGMAYEVAGVRILSQVLSGSIYTFANVLFVYLLCAGIGAWLYGVLAAKPRFHSWRWTEVLLWSLAATTLATSFVFGNTLQIHRALTAGPTSFARGILAEIAIAALAFGAPSLLMGALFSHLAAAFTPRGVGRAVAVNMLGAALAPLLFGLVLIDLAGYTLSYYLLPLAYLLLFAAVSRLYRFKRVVPLAAAGLVLLVALAAPRSMAHFVPLRGHRVVARHEGAMGHVIVQQAVRPLPNGVHTRELTVDRLHRMGGGAGYAEKRWGHMALMLSPRQGRALFLGLGTAGSMAAALAHDFDTVDGVELLPHVIDVLPYFAYLNDSILSNPRARVHCADARRFVAAARGKYEAIVADLYHPDAAGVSMLYSATHYRRMRALLTDDGICAQMVPMYQLNEEVLRTIVRTFLSVFPNTHAFTGHHSIHAPLILVGLNGPATQYARPIRRLNEAIAGNPGVRPYVNGVDDFLGSYLGGPEYLRAYAGDGPLNTDLHPHVMFAGPYRAYDTRTATSSENLRALEAHKHPPDSALVTLDTTAAARSLWASARAQSQALTYLHKGETLSQGHPPDSRPREAIVEYLKAYALHPGFMLHLGMPAMLEAMIPRYPKLILGSMLHATPELPGLREEYERVVGTSADSVLNLRGATISQ
ncbi:MAG: hypothetical protein GF331_02180 [Chitinivibrionales bacterium]|nr:hypothetical protein [Chitinivibrionales bacterium]